MRRQWSSNVNVLPNDPILEELIKESEQEQSLGTPHVKNKNLHFQGSDLSKSQKDINLDIESAAYVKRLQRNTSITIARNLFGRKTCLILILILVVFIVLCALLIHKILISVNDIEIDPPHSNPKVWLISHLMSENNLPFL